MSAAVQFFIDGEPVMHLTRVTPDVTPDRRLLELDVAARLARCEELLTLLDTHVRVLLYELREVAR